MPFTVEIQSLFRPLTSIQRHLNKQTNHNEHYSKSKTRIRKPKRRFMLKFAINMIILRAIMQATRGF